MFEQISDKEIMKIVDGFVRKQFDDAEILSVEIERAFDSDGDPILLVRVIFDDKKSKLDSHKKSGLLRSLLPKLHEQGINMFPVMSFVSRDDASGVAA